MLLFNIKIILYFIRKLYKNEKRTFYQLKKIKEILLELNWLKEMKKKNIIHRDLKSSNVL